ncbi:translation initiation factor IF-2-like [Drosophila obscura]|uniref:translation initiation factor IF-2-like n=1 Tax=Drosophila obscura TaxID=7282 RepID=UPI001BB27C44|nr:translation initiation factor IF-2-like [Drosophila obscura]
MTSWEPAPKKARPVAKRPAKRPSTEAEERPTVRRPTTDAEEREAEESGSRSGGGGSRWRQRRRRCGSVCAEEVCGRIAREGVAEGRGEEPRGRGEAERRGGGGSVAAFPSDAGAREPRPGHAGRGGGGAVAATATDRGRA